MGIGKRQSAIFFTFLLITIISACGTKSGRIGELPIITNTASDGKVVTIRISNIVGAANGYTVSLDGNDLYGIGSGEHAEFLVTEGEHYIAVKCFGGWTPTWKEDSLKFVANASNTSFFVISPNFQCAEIKAISEADAMKKLQGSKLLNLENKVTK